ncbi:MAG: type III glutamate--ammonia ligase [Rhodospirillaceae bacterium]|jgi:glutamine synthetase|nr:type III glutamate--ammonia ligase [Rhodospirillaceae bacterium]MBT4687941.1 type III glutamate--ammonia ligase [Rhodospirillaceae bacterium]MBT5079447.1 type III glutamate--ammonia ligase [Rhodospirillaceae bacterium]MBT5526908.1 type III glutamate--ammonia ligase [Rhodospirillaceae bacterium]MBT5878438.1 type III glutamate--ammonia ligase [Rhodospirillaceae bacterium]
MATDLAQYAEDNGIKFFLMNFTDLFGIQRSKLVPAAAIGGMQKSGAGFAGFAAWLDMTPAHPDMFAMPDGDAVIQLPWKPEVAWVPGDLYMDGNPVAQAPRNVLHAVISQAREMGILMKAGVEPEFHLINEDGSAISDQRDIQEKPCYDQSALMRRYDVIAEICSSLGQLGWGPYQNDHEDANGQFEINWDFYDCLKTADQLCFFRFLVKSIAEKHGLRATFMPKPFSHLTGNGCHVHASLWSLDGANCLTHDPNGELGISELGYHFLGGVLAHAQGLAAITNPTVNSYKRINAPATSSGSTWAPNTVTFGGNNRTHMVRVPDEGRFEFRLADGAANPYLLMAGYLAAGLDGIANKTDPGKRLDIDMYADGHKIRGAKKLPLYLIDAIRLFAKDKMLRTAFGDEFCDAYIKLKTNDWNQYSHHLTQWERDTTLDC